MDFVAAEVIELVVAVVDMLLQRDGGQRTDEQSHAKPFIHLNALFTFFSLTQKTFPCNKQKLFIVDFVNENSRKPRRTYTRERNRTPRNTSVTPLDQKDGMKRANYKLIILCEMFLCYFFNRS